MRTCSKCHTEKLLTEFHTTNDYRAGMRYYWCKLCLGEYQRERRRKKECAEKNIVYIDRSKIVSKPNKGSLSILLPENIHFQYLKARNCKFCSTGRYIKTKNIDRCPDCLREKMHQRVLVTTKL